jgi:hypothetical protein
MYKVRNRLKKTNEFILSEQIHITNSNWTIKDSYAIYTYEKR